MPLQEIVNLTSERTGTLPVAVLENLATRLRPGGAFLLMLDKDGASVWHDEGATAFFRKFVLPQVQSRPGVASPLAARLATLTPSSSVAIWNDLPGISIAAFPHVDRRQIAGVLLIAAKSSNFRLSEEIVRTCGQLGLDGIWLNQQADELPGYGEDASIRQARVLLSMLRDQIRLTGLETELTSLSGQLANTYEELSLIYQISSGMKINRSSVDFFKQACLDVLEVMNVRAMGVALCPDSESDQAPAVYGSIALPAPLLRRLSDELNVQLRARKEPLLINHLGRDKSLQWMSEYATQLLAVPLMRQEQVLGCMFALDKRESEFDTVDSKLLNSIANESAIYLENAMLFEDVRGLMMGLLHSLTSAVDAKDTYTCGHSERVALISRKLAQCAGLSENQVDRIYMAGLLHDVGKIGVPEAVLQKTGRLTPEEFEQIKKHPEIGARILRDVKQIEDIIPGVMHHHERYDGKGYPSGLAGENIPLMGRIICLADCFDAMTSSRTYRKALPLEVALTEIRRCAGTQFDPALTDAFLQIDPETLRELLKDHQSQSKKLIESQQSHKPTV